MRDIKKWADLQELFDGLEKYHRGYIVLNQKAYYKYQDKIDKIIKENYYKKDQWRGYFYILKKWKLEK